MSANQPGRESRPEVRPGQPLTRLPGPRVLIHDPGHYFSAFTTGAGDKYVPGAYDPEMLAERLRATVPTVEVARFLTDFNLNEWDCLVTDTAPVHMTTSSGPQHTRFEEPPPLYSWTQRYPRTLSIVCVTGAGELEILDAFPAEAKEQQPDLPDVAIVRDPSKVGRHITQVDGLPDQLASLVSRELLPVARSRQDHLSFRHWVSEFCPEGGRHSLSLRPFLLGPDDVVLAGSYERGADSSVWLLPKDLPDFFLWVVEALREWHSLYPSRFPALADWHDSADWRTAAERVIEQKREHLTESFAAKFADYQAQVAVLDEQAEAARTQANAYQRALVTADGDTLVEAVACSLAALGFHVVDMDQHWPEGDRREDLRVFDDSDPGWVSIVEVKGAKNGAKETEVQNFGRWAERFIIDEHRPPSARWFVTNHQRALDPTARQEAFANKPAVLTTFAKVDGSVIDTRALFDLVLLVEERPNLAGAARALLKSKPTVLTRVRANDLDGSDEECKTSSR